MKFQKLIENILRFDRWILWLGIPLFSILMHGKNFSLELTGPHVWRQAQTKQTIDSFVEEDFNILNPRKLDRGKTDGILRLEFPLYQWLVAAIEKGIGNSIFKTRFITFLFSCFLIWGMHALVFAAWRDRLTALIAAFLCAFSPLVYYYSICPLPDLLALTFAVWSLAFLMRCTHSFSWKVWIVSISLASLATLTKLPYGMFFASHLIWLFLQIKSSNSLRFNLTIKAASLIGLLLLPVLFWYAWVMPGWGDSETLNPLSIENWSWAEIGRILKENFVQLYPRTLVSFATLPLIFIGAFLFLGRRFEGASPQQMAILSGPVAFIFLFSLLEINVINTFHDYYLLPWVPFLLIPAAVASAKILRGNKMILIAATLCLLALIPYITMRRIHPRWRPDAAEFNRDLSIYQSGLRNSVPENALVVAGPDISHNVFLYYIHKKGWSWDVNQKFDSEKLKQWKNDGAEFFYCDQSSFVISPEIENLLGDEIGVFGTIHVYSLK